MATQTHKGATLVCLCSCFYCVSKDEPGSDAGRNIHYSSYSLLSYSLILPTPPGPHQMKASCLLLYLLRASVVKSFRKSSAIHYRCCLHDPLFIFPPFSFFIYHSIDFMFFLSYAVVILILPLYFSSFHNTKLLTRHMAVTSQPSSPPVSFSSSSSRLVWVTDSSSLTHFLAVNFLPRGTECRINSDKTKYMKASLSLLLYLFLRVIQNWVTAQKTLNKKLWQCFMWCHKLHIWIETWRKKITSRTIWSY